MEIWKTTTEVDDLSTYPECNNVHVETGTEVTVHYTMTRGDFGEVTLQGVTAYDPEDYEVDICDAVVDRLVRHLTDELSDARSESQYQSSVAYA